MVEIDWVLCFQHGSNVFAQSVITAIFGAVSSQKRRDPYSFSHDLCSPFFMSLWDVASFLYALERVAEWSMAKVVKQGRDERNFGAGGVEILLLYLSSNDAN
jgi:hypothetical protein